MTSTSRSRLMTALLWTSTLAAVTIAMLLVRSRLDKAHVALVYLLVVLGASSAGGRTLGLGIVGGAFLAFNYFFLPPYLTLVVSDPFDWLVLVAFVVTSAVAAQLLYRANTTAELATRRAAEVDRLATIGAETLSAPDARAALGAIATVIRESLTTGRCDLFRIDADGTPVWTAGAQAADSEHVATTGVPGADRVTGVQDETLIAWMAGRSASALELMDGTTRLDPVITDTLQVRALYRTLFVRSQAVGVLRVSSPDGLTLSSDRARLLDALSYYAALGMERMRLVTTAERAMAEREVEALRSSLLMAVSHDLRTPLTTIKGIAHEIAAGALSTGRAVMIEREADRLDAMVGDLLELSRIQAGAVRPVPTVNTADEVIGAALQRARGMLSDHVIAVSLTDDVLAARFDFTQTQRILVNLVENAAKYSPAGSTIEIIAMPAGSMLEISVTDVGSGVPAGEEERIFEAFHRPAATSRDVRGTGLGLSIARGLAVAQGGTVQFRRPTSGGSTFVLSVPLVVAPVDADESEAVQPG